MLILFQPCTSWGFVLNNTSGNPLPTGLYHIILRCIQSWTSSVRKDREILPRLRILTLSLVSWLTFLSMVVTIVQLTHPRVTCSLGELVLTYLLEEGHLNKIVFTKTVVNIITLLHADDKDGHHQFFNSWEAFSPFSSWISHSTGGPSAIFLLWWVKF